MPVFIKINDDYAIGSDSNRWMLKKSKTVKNKDTGEAEQGWDSFAYFTSMEQAIKSLGERMIRTSDVSSMPALLEAAKGISKLLTAKLPVNVKVTTE